MKKTTAVGCSCKFQCRDFRLEHQQNQTWSLIKHWTRDAICPVWFSLLSKGWDENTVCKWWGLHVQSGQRNSICRIWRRLLPKAISQPEATLWYVSRDLQNKSSLGWGERWQRVAPSIRWEILLSVCPMSWDIACADSADQDQGLSV